MRKVMWALVMMVGCGSPETPPVPEKPPEPPPVEKKVETPPPPPAEPAATLPAGANPALLDPSKATEKAPDVYKAKFETTKGDFVIEVHRDWAPNGADRFYNMVKIGYLDDVAFFRAIDGFMVQFGINGLPEVNDKWRDANIKDDPVTQSNTTGMVTFAQTNDVDSRSTQIFINFKDNKALDGMRFAPFGKVASGMDVVNSLYKGYGEGYPQGMGPDQQRVQFEGNKYLKAEFPKLDYVKKATILP
jgi:peptidyl-prolyl cis-trans isomerase A (cyclophilin A)